MNNLDKLQEIKDILPEDATPVQKHMVLVNFVCNPNPNPSVLKICQSLNLEMSNPVEISRLNQFSNLEREYAEMKEINPDQLGGITSPNSLYTAICSYIKSKTYTNNVQTDMGGR